MVVPRGGTLEVTGSTGSVTTGETEQGKGAGALHGRGDVGHRASLSLNLHLGMAESHAAGDDTGQRCNRIVQ